jgi:hypothetical protein
MKKILISPVILFILFLTDCKKIDNSFSDSSFINIAYMDKLGNDLLDTTRQNYFSHGSIHVYNVVKGIKKEVYNPMADYPHNFLIYDNQDLKSFYLRLFLETDTTFLELNKTTIDTITTVIYKTTNLRYIDKLWYNGDLKWQSGGLPNCSIVK